MTSSMMVTDSPSVLFVMTSSMVTDQFHIFLKMWKGYLSCTDYHVFNSMIKNNCNEFVLLKKKYDLVVMIHEHKKKKDRVWPILKEILSGEIYLLDKILINQVVKTTSEMLNISIKEKCTHCDITSSGVVRPYDECVFDITTAVGFTKEYTKTYATITRGSTSNLTEGDTYNFSEKIDKSVSIYKYIKGVSRWRIVWLFIWLYNSYPLYKILYDVFFYFTFGFGFGYGCARELWWIYSIYKSLKTIKNKNLVIRTFMVYGIVNILQFILTIIIVYLTTIYIKIASYFVK